MDNNNLNKMLNSLSQKLGVDKSKLESAAKNGKIDQVLKGSDSEQSQRISEVLSDPEKTRQILQSPQALALMKMLNKDSGKE